MSVRKSLARSDRIVSMIDGKPYASLKRHLKAHGLTPDQYRERYGLKADYPMVASAYSEARSASAKARGFGRKAATAPAAETAQEQSGPVAETAPEQADAASAGKPKAKAAGRKRLGIAGAKAAAKEHLGGAKDA